MLTTREAMPALAAIAKAPDVVIATSVDGESAGAAFSTSELYRYALWRVWDPTRPFWTFGMLNPSKADHIRLDPTVTRCIGHAQRGGAGGLIVWNLFAWRATDPADMKRAPNPVGMSNDRAIRALAQLGAVNIAAWGAHGAWQDRSATVRAMLAAD